MLALSGVVIITATTVEYFRLLYELRQEAYRIDPSSALVQNLSKAMLVFFIFGFGVGATDIVLRDVEPIYLFVTFVFFVGAIFIANLIKVQTNMVRDLRNKNLEMMKTLINVIEMKDPYTKGHSMHVYSIVEVFYDHLPPRYREKLNKPKLLDAALFHDIGKINVPDAILQKPDKLTDDEMMIIQTHAVKGKEMLDDTVFREISNWVLYHHERIDGQGYLGLTRDDIPLESRIIAIADTYSALSTDRVYRKKMSFDKAMSIIDSVAGSQLDEDLVHIFLTVDREKLEGKRKDLSSASVEQAIDDVAA